MVIRRLRTNEMPMMARLNSAWLAPFFASFYLRYEHSDFRTRWDLIPDGKPRGSWVVTGDMHGRYRVVGSLHLGQLDETIESWTRMRAAAFAALVIYQGSGSRAEPDCA